MKPTMPDQGTVLSQLVAMSLQIGDPSNDYVILGEGNTSARVDDEGFYVKASGTQLPTIDENGFVRVAFAPVRAMLGKESMTDDEVKDGLEAATVDGEGMRPSVETFLHAGLLALPGIEFIAHTHPTPINALLCSERAEEAVAGRLFPDEIVCCGPESAWVPYTDPGLPLAQATMAAVDEFIEKWNMPPRVIMMQNHGMIALAETVADVLGATAMAVKAARVRIDTQTFGPMHTLSSEQVDRIFTRPDEHYRQRKLGG